MKLPEPFLQHLHRHFPAAICERILSGFDGKPATGVRLHPQKACDHLSGQQVAWTSNGLLLTDRPHFGHDPHWHGGAYYVQDPSSMALDHVLKRIPLPSNDALALDLCAAPGGKSLSVLDRLGEHGFLIANELDPKRNAILRENLVKWGSTRQAVSQLSIEQFAVLEGVFDLIVLDAPCSGEGMFRKDPYAVEQWSEQLVQRCAHTQGDLIKGAMKLLKPGGVLVYSTCTMNALENEQQVEDMINAGMDLLPISFAEFQAHVVPAMRGDQVLGHYLLPGISLGEGLFIAALQKQEGSEPTPLRKNFQAQLSPPPDDSIVQLPHGFAWQPGDIGYVVEGMDIASRFIPEDFPFKSVGLDAFQTKGKIRIPAHGITMHPHAPSDQALEREEALLYLRKQSIPVAKNADKGWKIVSFEQTNLGWVKLAPGRMNNHYPINLRIRT